MAELIPFRKDIPFDVKPTPMGSIIPSLFRVMSIERLPANGSGILNRAQLYHDAACPTVEWICRHPDTRITRGSLVSVRWSGLPARPDTTRISRLVLSERPLPEVDLFDLVPESWVKDRSLVRQASALWECLPRGFRHLFNALFWDGRRFHRYLMGPSSLAHHHNTINGNFRHSVDVAEAARAMADTHTPIDRAILVLGGLIHDAGKADEYRYDRQRRRFVMSDAGSLIGHRDRLQQWIGAAMAAHRVIIPESQLLALLHALTAARGAPRWLGLREPMSLECSILSLVDRLSGEDEFFARLAKPGGGFGQYSQHLQGRPYVVRNESATCTDY